MRKYLSQLYFPQILQKNGRCGVNIHLLYNISSGLLNGKDHVTLHVVKYNVQPVCIVASHSLFPYLAACLFPHVWDLSTFNLCGQNTPRRHTAFVLPSVRFSFTHPFFLSCKCHCQVHSFIKHCCILYYFPLFSHTALNMRNTVSFLLQAIIMMIQVVCLSSQRRKETNKKYSLPLLIS